MLVLEIDPRLLVRVFSKLLTTACPEPAGFNTAIDGSDLPTEKRKDGIDLSQTFKPVSSGLIWTAERPTNAASNWMDP
ncbi:MAG: hypothetical protein R2849_13480 [Thermomicrobiales bacterium]